MTDCDVAVVGAGGAGIGAARRVLEAGLTCRVIEARRHVGGRAPTQMMRGHPVDLGAHWLHAGPRNPLVALARLRGERLRPVSPVRHAYHAGRPLDAAGAAMAGLGWDKVVQAVAGTARRPADLPADADLPPLGRFTRRTLAVHGLVCGRPLHEASAKDFDAAQDEDDSNWFIAGGYGAYLERLAAGLPITFGAPVRRITLTSGGVTLETAAGRLQARAVIVTVPVMVLQTGVITFEPGLPEPLARALSAFLPGTYEHVILHWPRPPFSGADRLLGISGSRFDHVSMLTHIDGSAFHYLELDHETINSVGERRVVFAREALAATFGRRSLQGVTVQHATDWRHDPFARGSWSVVPAGHFGIRQALAEPVEGRVWFAGEATSAGQWGTVGGAWQEGTRAAAAIAKKLRG